MKLLIEDDEGNRNVVPVIRDEITIGRKEDNTIRLTERNVSRHHARLLRNDGNLYIEDVEARYGIKKNGREIDERAVFSEGDVVLIGDYRLTLRPEQAQEADPSDGEQVAAEISSDLQEPADREDRGAGDAPSAPIEDEPTQVQKKDEVEGAPGDAGPATGAPEAAGSSTSDTQIIETEPAELVVVSSNFAGQEFPLDRDEMVIGRGEDCDIIIDHRSVSNTHAKVVREGPEDYKIVDLNSRNGVKIDGDDYKSAHLERGDIVELGHVKFRFVEPGENYVFSPQDQPAAPAGDVSSSDSSGLVGIGVGAAVLVAGLVAGYLFLLSGGSESDTSAEGASESAESDERRASGPATGSDTGGDDKVVEILERAKARIEKGELKQAKSSLKTARSLIESSNDKNDRIDKLLAKAKREEPRLESYEAARDAIDDEEWQTALEQLAKIPKFSTFNDLIAEKGMRERAVDGAMNRAESLYDRESYDEAEALAELADDARVDSDRPADLLAKIQEAREDDGEKTTVARAGTDGTNSPKAADDKRDSDRREGGRESERNSESNESSGTASEESGQSGGGSESENRGISGAQGKKLYDSAMKKAINGNPGGAIADCTRALRAGYTQCHRVLGSAYKQKGKTGPACRHFRQYLATDPQDASRIRNVVSNLNCD